MWLMTKLQVKLVKTKEGMLAQCLDRPEIIVVGKNKSTIKSKLEEIIEGYVIAFPETKNDFFTNKNKMIDTNFIAV